MARLSDLGPMRTTLETAIEQHQTGVRSRSRAVDGWEMKGVRCQMRRSSSFVAAQTRWRTSSSTSSFRTYRLENRCR